MTAKISALATDPLMALQRGATYAPYLSRLLKSCGEDISAKGASDAFEFAMEAVHSIADDGPPDAAMTQLREAKRLAHASLAALDLSATLETTSITTQLTRFADACVAKALSVSLAEQGLSTDGIFVIALGKMGAFELNYSSDIDFVVFYDPDSFDGGSREPGDAAIRTVQSVIRLVEKQTSDGYVFRTDLRLRPDPSSTPVAVSTRRASVYYESVGQNWERMVWIKARPIAGDLEAAAAFLRQLVPFVWRQHLDYWAIADVHAIKNMIHSQANRTSTGADANLKLGPGGIREIEFFAQTQQVILGGRVPSLRVPGTLDALDALTEYGAVPAKVRDDLAAAYPFLRDVEHRIQMLEDAQTHSLPGNRAGVEAVAGLCGFETVEDFLDQLNAVRATVNRHYGDLFADEVRKRDAAISGNLVFTGVDIDPGTVETLTGLGFDKPEDVINTISRWHRGRTPATRTARGRELLTALIPELLAMMSRTGEPDRAFLLFSRFLEGLSSGVQTLSMLLAKPRLLEDLVATLALAPQIGTILARRPTLLEALVSDEVQRTPPEITSETDFETAIDAFRRWHREQAFLIGHRLLHGVLPARDVAADWTRLAEVSLVEMASAAEAETIRRFGPAPGRWSIAALGKLGGEDLTAESDLDLIVIFDPGDHDGAQSWFTRFTQRLISAVSSDTAEGRLYEVDMRLRPSGRAGPVATSISAFEKYHRNDAWTWELMALTRLRMVAGDTELRKSVEALAGQIIAGASERPNLREDILDMRRRLWREKPPVGDWDLKQRAGGMVDLEFLVQQELLLCPNAEIWSPRLDQAIAGLERVGQLTDTEAKALQDAHQFLTGLQQIQRLALGSEATAPPVSHGLKDRLARAVGLESFADVESTLSATCATVETLRCKKIGSLATESG